MNLGPGPRGHLSPSFLEEEKQDGKSSYKGTGLDHPPAVLDVLGPPRCWAAAEGDERYPFLKRVHLKENIK